VGDADRGFGRDRPGGWVYSVLPFIEQQAVWSLPADGQPNLITDRQKAKAMEMVHVLLPTFVCPSRRMLKRFPKPANGEFVAHNSADFASDQMVARSDYAANMGHSTKFWLHDWSGPPPEIDLAAVQTEASVAWPDQRVGFTGEFTGLAFVRSEVQPRQIADGLSKTYLLGERYICPKWIEFGTSSSDNETWVQGCNNDMLRSGGWAPK